jgi:hypothetical protein
MAVTTIVAFDADDNKVDIYTTDDPAEGGGSKLQDIVDALGEETATGDEADSTAEAALNERLAALTDALRSGKDNDALRVALAEDLLSGALSVSVDAQSGAFTVTDDGGFALSANDGTDIGDVGIEDIAPVTGQATKSASLPVTLASDRDTVPTALQDLSPVTGQSAKSGSVPVTLASDEDNVGVEVESISSVTGEAQESGSLPVTLASDETKVPVEQQTPVQVEDSGGTGIDPAKNIDGVSTAATVTDTTNATVQVPNGRTTVTVMVAASGGPVDATVEVSTDGTNWYEETDVFSANVADGDTEAETFRTGADYVRASGDANVGRVEVAAKGA